MEALSGSSLRDFGIIFLFTMYYRHRYIHGNKKTSAAMDFCLERPAHYICEKTLELIASPTTRGVSDSERTVEESERFLH